MRKGLVLENILWSIALPGFAQLLNKSYLKGFFFISLEFVINIKANFNQTILLSFHGRIQEAIGITNFQWLMFYPCLYFFAMWDACKECGVKLPLFASLPFVFSAYFVTVGLILSPELKLFGKLLGPVWLPMLFVIPGVCIGFLLKKILSTFT
ncbi:hypothetical protein ACTQ5K_03115 [Niallia sp. Sow4_A1]|uniref:hypothetical protein n=1 Tax=Bacillaceae TaxID=186817 RepID=UPI0004E143FF|nr:MULTISPECIES: hypothetical protein [unclassified Bacillus (in: firmicutes)]CAI9391607.1 hypothetical protein BACSP_03064 [Bacillus sp. T2.9-1]